MAVHNTKMQSLIEEEVSKVKGTSIPVRAGRLERLFVRKVKCSKLHPNPNDEFCFPEIGPNEGIVSGYEKEFRRIKADGIAKGFDTSSALAPLIVQKIQPDGYMILNGHHRWIAAIRAGISQLQIRIVNLTQEKDIRKMLKHSRHDKRITLDLDEVVFSDGKVEITEKPLAFPFNRIYRQRIRMGIPALFSYSVSAGYDIWLYCSGYESMDYVRDLLKLYHAPVTGIITGAARKMPKDSKAREDFEALMNSKYHRTIHAENDIVLCIDSINKEYKEFPLNKSGIWSAEIMEIIGALEKNE